MSNLTVINTNGQFTIDSREVAEMTGKRHDHLLRDIDGYIKILDNSETPNLGSLNFFIPSTYTVEGNNKLYLCYLLTRKGCDMVANKMTGEKGVLFTAAYVTKFEEMEKAINLPQNYKQALLALVAAEEEKEKLLLENTMKEQIICELQPKATYYDLILQSKAAIPISQISKDYGMSAKRFNDLLHELHVQYKQTDTWLLYIEHADKGYTTSKTHHYINNIGIECSKLHTYWTQKGRLFIYDLLKNKKSILPTMERALSA